MRIRAAQITGNSLPVAAEEGVVRASKLTYAQKKGSYVWINGDHQPQSTTAANSTTGASGYGDPTGTAGDTNFVRYHSGNYGLMAQAFVTGTQTILGPIFDPAIGIDLSQDQTNNDGVQIVWGALGVASKFAFTIGTDAAFFIRFKFYIDDVSGFDLLEVGFRKNEAFATDPEDYNDKAGLNSLNGEIYSSTIKTNAATVNTDTGVAITDGSTVELEVRVSAAGVASYWINNVQKQTSVAYTFTSGLVVVPYTNIRQDSDVGKVYLKELEIGPQSERNRD